MDVPPILRKLEGARTRWLNLVVDQITNYGVISHIAVDELEAWHRKIEKELQAFVCPPEAEILNDD